MARSLECEASFKVVMVGDHYVGKSCLARRFATDTYFEGGASTVGAAYYSQMVDVDGGLVKVQIWDTAGQELFRSVVPLYYRMAQGVVVVYDTTDERSFLSVPRWLETSFRYTEPDAVDVLLLGNKCDWPHLRQVSYRRGLTLADGKAMPFVETSAKEGTNVQAAFMKLVRAMKKRFDEANGQLLSCAEPALDVHHVADNVRFCC